MRAKKPRIGRPPIPKKLHKDSLLSIRFSVEERRLLEREAKGEKLSTWARQALLALASLPIAAPPEPAQEPPSEQP